MKLSEILEYIIAICNEIYGNGQDQTIFGQIVQTEDVDQSCLKAPMPFWIGRPHQQKSQASGLKKITGILQV